MLGMIRQTEENDMIFTTGTMVVTFKKQNGEVRTLVGTLFPPTYTGDYRAALKSIICFDCPPVVIFGYNLILLVGCRHMVECL